ncbi:unnamed protein product [Sphenostylis stenocarpa]|uniref:Sugar phosphate transporter domain-containing protein n=1 Tax=Sphenostylis stenocarpa TaxID=92480 RepID=A0AA86SZ47_9FABA|nr:unnamed protein product [Sphenostylis stenocarpa]
MICTVKQPSISIVASHVLLRKKGSSSTPVQSCSVVVPSSHLRENTLRSLVSVQKPLHLSCVGLGNFVGCPVRRERGHLGTCRAYEAERPEVEGAGNPSEAAKKVKIGIYFATWWALNVVFNIYNKKVLNVYPYPWLTSTLSLACGSLLMLISWATRIAEPPKTDLEFWKTLFPVAVAHTIGHVAATVSMSKVAVSFTHIIKSGEPAFSVLVSRFLLGETFPVPVYLSLIPIIGGCALAAVTELNFNMIGFMGAMISNLAFVFRNIFSKKGMKGKAVSGMNYYACLSILSLAILTPFAIAVEGPQMWAAGWQTALSQIGPQFILWMAAQSIFYHLYNQVSYMSLDEISPLTFSIGNTMKRISVIVSSIIIFHTPVQPVNALGAAIAIFGTFLYSQCFEPWRILCKGCTREDSEGNLWVTDCRVIRGTNFKVEEHALSSEKTLAMEASLNWFSEFPSQLLLTIVSLLPFKDAVRTSVLSKQCQHVGTREAQRKSFLDFIKFWIENHKGTVLNKFSLRLSMPEKVTEVIDGCIILSHKVYNCSLESFKLYSCSFLETEVFSFHELKEVSLGWMEVKLSAIKALLSNCEKLESRVYVSQNAGA